MIEVSLDEIEETVCAALIAHGADGFVAASVANAVRVAESKGNKICGLYYVDSYCTQLRTGRVSGVAIPVVSQPKPGTVRVDAQLGFAQPAFAAGFQTAVSATRANGTCGFSIEHSHTATALGYFTEQFARENLLAIGLTNATPVVAPPGGNKRLLGTNPMAMAVPGGNNDVAFQFDYSTSAVALGKITMAAAAGEDIPLGWAIDAEGNPTTDPQAALKGSLVSAGGHKGYGLGLMVEVLAAAMTGSNLSANVPPLKAPEGPPHNIGQFYLVIDPAAFAAGDFYDSLAELAERVSEQEGARLPGTGSTAGHIVAVDQSAWEQVSSLAR